LKGAVHCGEVIHLTLGMGVPTINGNVNLSQDLNQNFSITLSYLLFFDSLCGLVGRVPGNRSREPGSIPNATRFYETWWVWNGVP
jgi:hypothetical protein